MALNWTGHLVAPTACICSILTPFPHLQRASASPQTNHMGGGGRVGAVRAGDQEVLSSLSTPCSILFLPPTHCLWSLAKITSLIAQLVRNPPAMQETLVQLLGWEDLLEKG